MSLINFNLTIKAILSAMVLGVLLLFSAANAKAAVNDWQKGFSLIPQSTTDFASNNFRQSLQNLRQTGANYVTLIIPYYQDTINSTAMSSGNNTPSDDSLIQAIDYAHSLGFAVNLNIHLESRDTDWRANINPRDRATWFTNYGLVLNHYAILSQNNHVEMYTLGAELINMTSDNIHPTNTANWRNLISTVRSLYSGKITYDGNWGGGVWNDELHHIKFWDDLDYIGVSAYYHIGGSSINNYSAESLRQAWDKINKNELAPLQRAYNKPILFTEIGFRSVDGNLIHPASWKMNGAVDEQEQADGYQSVFDYWQDYPYFAGVQFWDWKTDPYAGGPNDTDFTVQAKLAGSIVSNWFLHNSPGPSVPSTPDSSADIIYVSDLQWKYNQNGWGPNERDQSNGEQAGGDGRTLTLNGKTYTKGIGGNAKSKIIFDLPPNCTEFTSDIGVDDEISTKGSVVFQVWRDETGQKIYDSGLMTYDLPAKNIVVNITGWKAMGLIINDAGNGNGKDHGDWADAKLRCENPSPSPTPPPPPIPSLPPATKHEIALWGLSDGANVNGLFPFQAVLANTEISEYQMYWQVDNDRLNPMPTAGDHKEAWVDVSGWFWHQNGPYSITFLAYDNSGKNLASKTIKIYISR